MIHMLLLAQGGSMGYCHWQLVLQKQVRAGAFANPSLGRGPTKGLAASCAQSTERGDGMGCAGYDRAAGGRDGPAGWAAGAGSHDCVAQRCAAQRRRARWWLLCACIRSVRFRWPLHLNPCFLLPPDTSKLLQSCASRLACSCICGLMMNASSGEIIR